jgi:RNA polymerase sigma-70 factor, ECF subfamily
MPNVSEVPEVNCYTLLNLGTSSTFNTSKIFINLSLSAMNLNDFQIQRKIQNGDIKEYERLFVKYYEPLCQFAFKFLKDMDLAEDIVQEFFYNFWKNRETFSLKLSLNSYLYQSIRNNSLHYLGHLAIRQKYAETIKSEINEQHFFTELDEPGLNELNKVIDETLKQLPERCSRIFSMNRFEGKKYKEIAEILSVSIKTVEADMGKALQVFRNSLKDFKTS